MFEPISVRPLSPRPFSGRLVRHELGPLQLLRLSADASAARRTHRLIGTDDPENLEVMLQIGGACAISQDDRESLIPEGDIGCWHSSAPYVVEADVSFDMLILTCPSSLLAHDADRFRNRTAQRIDASRGIGALVRLHLTSLVELLDADGCPSPVRQHVAEGLLDLIRALHTPADAAVGPGPAAQQLRAQIDSYIDAHLSDETLSRSTIARGNFISPRTLDRLYETGVWHTVRARRLERARRDLSDPSLTHESVLAIASRWGFVSPSHFTRAFSAAYGQPPGVYRRSTFNAGAAGGADPAD